MAKLQERFGKFFGVLVLNLNYYPLFTIKVLKLHTGIPITLSTIYSAIAKRFGIHLEPVSFR